MRKTETRSQRALRLEGDTPKCLAFELRPFLISLVFGSSLPSHTFWPFFLVCSEPGWPLLTVALGSALPAPPSRQAPLMGEAVVHGAQTRWFKEQNHSLTVSKSDLWVAGGRLWHPPGLSAGIWYLPASFLSSLVFTGHLFPVYPLHVRVPVTGLKGHSYPG